MSPQRIVWLTDVHFNFVGLDVVERLLGEIEQERPAAVLWGGDIGEAHDVTDWLLLMSQRLSSPTYFVLGNHDYYHGSIAGVREAVGELCAKRQSLNYLTREGVCRLAPGTALVGHDGWSDARAGNFAESTVVLNDYLLIEELRGVSRSERREILGRLGDEAASHIRTQLRAALAEYRSVVLLMHPPPMQQACWHEGRTSDDNWAPHFTCAAAGEAILEIMSELPDRRLTVLCGHTHSAGVVRPLSNVEIITGAAQYGRPEITRVFEVE